MLAQCPSPRRPPLTAPRGQLRAAYRLSAGLSPAAVARAEAVAERDITGLLAQPDFQELVEALEELQGLPEEERLLRLERHAWCVLEMALADSDWRAAAFVADQLRRGFNPARMLAKGVLKAQARAAAPPPTPAAKPAAPPPPRAAPPYDPVGAAMRRAAAAMRDSIAAETALALGPGRPATTPAPPGHRERAERPGTATPAGRPGRPPARRQRHAAGHRHPPARPAARLGAGAVTANA
jgi:hypothetical protein